MSGKQDLSRRKFLVAAGGTAAVTAAGCIGDDDTEPTPTPTPPPDDTPTPTPPPGEPTPQTEADKAQAAWERIVDNPAPEDEPIRTQAYIEIEEAVRDSGILIPLMHGLTELFWWEHVDLPHTGALGQHHQVHTETEVDGDTELSLINSEFFTLDPAHSADTASAQVINQMYETLTNYPNGVPELHNQLLESFDVTEDGMTWTFTIKEGIEFHGGQELTAHDFVYSWERLAMSANSTRHNFILGGGGFLGLDYEEHEDEDEGWGPFNVEPGTLGVEVVDEYTFEIDIRFPQPGVLDILTYTGFAVIPEGWVGDIPGYDGEVAYEDYNLGTAANGTGPFIFDTFTEAEAARVVRNDDYHGQAASLESVHWSIIEDADAAFTYAMEMNADVFGVPTAQYDPDLIDAEEDDRGRDVGTYGPHENGEMSNYLAVPTLSTFYWGFNAAEVPKPVRQAVNYVTNRPELVEEIFENRAVEAFSFSPPPLWPTGHEGYQDWVAEFPFAPGETDIPSAMEVLEEAGYTEDDPFELTLTTYVSPVFEQAAELTRDKLAGTGVEMDLEEAPFGTLISRGYDGGLEMFSLGWIWSWEDIVYGHYGFEPKNTDLSRMPEETSGYMLNWQVELTEEFQ